MNPDMEKIKRYIIEVFHTFTNVFTAKITRSGEIGIVDEIEINKFFNPILSVCIIQDFCIRRYILPTVMAAITIKAILHIIY